MRIIGGRFRGTRLAAPGADGGGKAHLRPTSDRVREALFNLLAHGGYGDPPPPENRRVLDLFAGAGALGLEALSRGAQHVLFVDDFPKARALIRQNVETLHATGDTKIYRRDATRLGPCRTEPFDLVFMDPPYRQGLGGPAIGSALAGGWLSDKALLVWETAADEPEPEAPGFTKEDTRTYGETRLTFLGRQPPDHGG